MLSIYTIHDGVETSGAAPAEKIMEGIFSEETNNRHVFLFNVIDRNPFRKHLGIINQCRH